MKARYIASLSLAVGIAGLAGYFDQINKQPAAVACIYLAAIIALVSLGLWLITEIMGKIIDAFSEERLLDRKLNFVLTTASITHLEEMNTSPTTAGNPRPRESSSRRGMDLDSEEDEARFKEKVAIRSKKLKRIVEKIVEEDD